MLSETGKKMLFAIVMGREGKREALCIILPHGYQDKIRGRCGLKNSYPGCVSSKCGGVLPEITARPKGQV